ncbi:MAG: hypothetical protein V8S87_10350 [Oscillospiraceae bacterium]
MREAFRTLEGEKLLEINAYKGATVLRIDETFVREIYGLLCALECLIYESALPYIDDELIDELKSVNEEIGLIAAGQTLSTGYIDLKTQFHGLIMSRRQRKLSSFTAITICLSAHCAKAICPASCAYRECTASMRNLSPRSKKKMHMPSRPRSTSTLATRWRTS